MVQIRIIDGKNYLEVDGDLHEITKSFVEKKTGKRWHYLPENPANRKLIDEDKMVDGYELKFRETRTIGSYNTGNKKHFTEYLEPEELAEYNRLVELAYNRKKEAEKKPQLTEAQKLMAKIAKMQALLADMTAEDEAMKDAE
jgi:hypothetical protein